MLAVIALLVPALFNYTERGIFASTEATSLDEKLSLSVAIVLIVVYAANLAYTLITHRDVFALDEAPEKAEAAWPLWRAIVVLLIATAATAWMADLVSGALEKVPGVQVGEVRVGAARVQAPENVPESAIVSAVEKAGYPAVVER